MVPHFKRVFYKVCILLILHCKGVEYDILALLSQYACYHMSFLTVRIVGRLLYQFCPVLQNREVEILG